MTEREIFKGEVLEKLKEGKIERNKAAEELGISLRQVDRLKIRYSQKGLAGLVHGNRGRASNRAIKKSKILMVKEILHENYPDFKPTLASEKLLDRHGIKMSKEKVRQLMIEEGLWASKKRKAGRVYQRRTRRSRRGELLQGDGSFHDWFEGRAGRCCLVSFIDDATGEVSARFEPSETREGYCRLLRSYIIEHGCPRALYVDKSSIFRVNSGKNPGQGKTVFGKILQGLKIDLICANSPQAKGRVERMYKTFQDRVVKEMRLAKVTNIEEANKFLEWYLPIYNKRFSKAAGSEEDAHVPIGGEDAINRAFTRKETRKLSKSLEFSFERVIYQIVDTSCPRRMVNQMVTVCVNMQGNLWVEWKGNLLKIKRYNELSVDPDIMERKEVDAWLDAKVEAVC